MHLMSQVNLYLYCSDSFFLQRSSASLHELDWEGGQKHEWAHLQKLEVQRYCNKRLIPDVKKYAIKGEH